MLKLSHPIISINGFKIGDKVRLKDGDGRPHIIKSFSIDGMKEFFFEVQFEDGTEAMLDNIAPLSSNLDEAAEEYAWKKEEPLAEWERLSACFNCFNPRIEAFKAGAEWMAGQFVWVGGEPTGWFSTNDGSEYATGLDLKDPIKLPVDFYARKK